MQLAALALTDRGQVRGAEGVTAVPRAAGIAPAKHAIADVAEEAGHASKDVDQVTRVSRELVEPVFRLPPPDVMKG